MASIIKDHKGGSIYINLFNIAYGAEPEDIHEFYKGIDFELDEIKKGTYLAIFKTQDEALKMVEAGTGVTAALEAIVC